MIVAACNRHFIRCFVFAMAVIPSCFASGQAYLGASMGASFAQIGKSAPVISYFSGATITDAYPVRDNHASSAVLSVHGGYELVVSDSLPTIAFGLGVYSTLNHLNFSGLVIETAEGDDSFLLYDYAYHVNSARLMAEVQLSWALANWSPFISGGVGAARNRSSGYNETATTSIGYPPLPAFQSHTTTQFAWQAGVGISHDVRFLNTKSDTSKERIALGYRYVDAGAASFSGRNAAYPYPLKTGSLTSNDLYIGYTHLF